MDNPNQDRDLRKTTRTPRDPRQLEACPEFRNANIESFMKHLYEGTCEECLTLLPAAARFAEPIRTEKRAYSAAAGASLGTATMGRGGNTVDRWLAREYSLIPQAQRPMVGSNDWFHWLDQFQQRHPAEVSKLDEPLARRAYQVLWNSK
jgi:hypothetical protein